MSRILVDTSAYSGFLRGDEWIKSAIQEAEEININAIILGELRAGFAAGRRREKNELELRRFLGSSRVDVVPIDEETSIYYAEIYATLRAMGKPIPSNDLWIAATAMQHGLQLLTTDGHFKNVPQIIVLGPGN